MKKIKFLDKTNNFFKKLYKENKKLFFGLIFCCVLVVVIFVFSFVDGSSKKQNTVSDNSNNISISDYSASIENKLVSMLLSLKEIDSASAFVMVESTPTVKYLTEVDETSTPSDKGTISSKSETVVFEKNGSVTSPIVVTTIAPKITGVLIVTNKINASTKLSIINSVSIVLNIDESCITILQKQ